MNKKEQQQEKKPDIGTALFVSWMLFWSVMYSLFFLAYVIDWFRVPEVFLIAMFIMTTINSIVLMFTTTLGAVILKLVEENK